MTGLDKILSQIASEARSSADAKIAQAQQQADVIINDMEKQGKAACEDIAQKSAAEVAAVLARAESSAALQKRKAILSAKQQIIGEIIEKAKQSIYAMPQDEYFKLILKMATKYVLPQSGEILFSDRDLSRLPGDFEKSLNSAIKVKGAVLKISQETRAIDGGFVLVYDDVEENCSVAALFDAIRDTLQDKVHELLFS